MTVGCLVGRTDCTHEQDGVGEDGCSFGQCVEGSQMTGGHLFMLLLGLKETEKKQEAREGWKEGGGRKGEIDKEEDKEGGMEGGRERRREGEREEGEGKLYTDRQASKMERTEEQ